METTLSVQNIGKHFGSLKAVDDISFTVEKGEVLGFLGPNGAGKSTTMKMLTCFIPPTFGTARVGGFDIIGESLRVRQIVGYMPENAPAYGEMDVKSFLEFIAEVRGFDGKERGRRVDQAVERTHLESVLKQEIETLSKGFRSRVSLAQALIHDPPVLILDEPTDGLDPNQKHEVRTLIRELAPEKVVVLSSHILEEVDAVCSRAIIISSGKIVADGTPDELRRQSFYAGAVDISLKTGSAPGAHDILRGISGVEGLEILYDDDTLLRFLVIPEKDQRIDQEVYRVASENKWHIEAFSVERGRLDEVFRTITTGDGGLS